MSVEALEWEICAQDAHSFIFGLDIPGSPTKRYLMTKDEHRSDGAMQPFPDKPYLRALIDCFLVSGGFIKPKDAKYALDWTYYDAMGQFGGFSMEFLEEIAETHMMALEKSRQMTITWVVLAYILWRAKFHDYQLILVQSKREDDAKMLVCVKETEPDAARLTFMESHLPDHLKSVDFKKKGATTKCNVFFDNGSHVWGIPEGGHLIRSHTPSLVFSDESAFQPQFGESYRAMLPAVHGGGQALFVSSAEPGEFQQLVESDKVNV